MSRISLYTLSAVAILLFSVALCDPAAGASEEVADAAEDTLLKGSLDAAHGGSVAFDPQSTGEQHNGAEHEGDVDQPLLTMSTNDGVFILRDENGAALFEGNSKRSGYEKGIEGDVLLPSVDVLEHLSEEKQRNSDLDMSQSLIYVHAKTENVDKLVQLAESTKEKPIPIVDFAHFVPNFNHNMEKTGEQLFESARAYNVRFEQIWHKGSDEAGLSYGDDEFMSHLVFDRIELSQTTADDRKVACKFDRVSGAIERT